jgi:hypothetical protein
MIVIAVSYPFPGRRRNRGNAPPSNFHSEAHRMRTLSLLAATAFLAAPLAAQGGRPSDPDNKVAGGGTVPAGWSYRLEDPAASIANAKFVAMGPNGLHFTTGPAGIYWREADAVSGAFHTVATFIQTKAPMHPEAYGLFVAGKDLKGAGASYIYLIVRGDGMFSIRQGGAAGTPSTNITQGNRNGWSPDDAVAKQDSAGKASNKLEISSDGKTLKFMVNGKTVHEMPAPAGGGLVGIRMNHNLDVHIDGFAVHKM